MELKEFVSEVLSDIFLSVADDQKIIANQGGRVNPDISTTTSGVVICPVVDCGVGSPYKSLCVAEFDVALTIADKEQKSGKIGVLFGNLGIGAGKSESAESSEVTRVKFSVPYRLP